MQASFIISLQAGLLALDRGAEQVNSNYIVPVAGRLRRSLAGANACSKCIANINLNITEAKNAVE
jgi:hypothetical protein